MAARDWLDARFLELVPMPQLAEAFDKGDDWTGLTDARARRKRQNRLNKRASRRRKFNISEPQPRSPNSADKWRPMQGSMLKHELVFVSQTPCSDSMSPLFDQLLPQEVALTRKHGQDPSALHSKTTMPVSALPMYTGNFPLSTDHLLTLIQFNVFRATLTNMSLLSLLDIFFPTITPPAVPLPATIPASLAPTPLQRSTTHAPWIDIFPLGAMRDNLIMAEGKYDDRALCSDMLSGMFGALGEQEYRGFIVWRDPWDVDGWEVSAGFVRRWGWLLKGCGELVESTNRWRRMRDEEALIIEV